MAYATHLSQSNIVSQIERLVKSVIHYDGPIFRISLDAQGDKLIESTELSRYFDHIRQMCDWMNDEGCNRSECLIAFREAYYDIGIEFGVAGMTCLSESEDSCLSVGPGPKTWAQVQYQQRERVRHRWPRLNQRQRIFAAEQ